MASCLDCIPPLMMDQPLKHPLLFCVCRLTIFSPQPFTSTQFFTLLTSKGHALNIHFLTDTCAETPEPSTSQGQVTDSRKEIVINNKMQVNCNNKKVRGLFEGPIVTVAQLEPEVSLLLSLSLVTRFSNQYFSLVQV